MALGLTLPTNIDLNALIPKVVDGAKTFYEAQTAIETAKANSQLARAQAQAAVNQAKAAGQATVATAAIGLPSTSLLLVGFLALAGLAVLRR